MRSVRTKPNQMAIDGANRYFLWESLSLELVCSGCKKIIIRLINNGTRRKAYEAAWEVYEPLYPLLKHKPEFLFEVAQCLSKTGRYEKANGYLERAVLLSSDPMLYYVMAKNEQCLGEYRQAEKHLLHAIDILPERIYPYYLLMNLYTEPSYFQPTKLKMAIDSVLTKKPKVESSAIKEMKEKARSMLNNTSI